MYDDDVNAASALRGILQNQWISRWENGDDYDDIVDDLVAVGGSLEIGVRVFDDGIRDKFRRSKQTRDLFFADLDGNDDDDDDVKADKDDLVLELG